MYDYAMGTNYYDGAIWTNHALARLKDRGFSKDMAGLTFKNPDRSRPGSEKGTILSQKRFGGHTVSVVSKQNEKNEWIILSCWIDPPLAGTDDEKKNIAYRKYHQATAIEKIWITVKRQLGLSKY